MDNRYLDDDINEEVFKLAKEGKTDEVNALIKTGASPFYAVQGAAVAGNITLVEALINDTNDRKDKQKMVNDAMIGAGRCVKRDADNNNRRLGLEIIEKLTNNPDPTQPRGDIKFAFRGAAMVANKDNYNTSLLNVLDRSDYYKNATSEQQAEINKQKQKGFELRDKPLESGKNLNTDSPAQSQAKSNNKKDDDAASKTLPIILGILAVVAVAGIIAAIVLTGGAALPVIAAPLAIAFGVGVKAAVIATAAVAATATVIAGVGFIAKKIGLTNSMKKIRAVNQNEQNKSAENDNVTINQNTNTNTNTNTGNLADNSRMQHRSNSSTGNTFNALHVSSNQINAHTTLPPLPSKPQTPAPAPSPTSTPKQTVVSDETESNSRTRKLS